jgi:Na+-driven multidrug efflux pump
LAGLGDTRTPLVYSLLFTALNIILDPLFIFHFGFGASGAAAGTALAQYAALIPLLMALNKKVKINIFGQLDELKTALKNYLEAGAFVFIRTVGKVLAYSVCAREAALLGTVAAAAYNLTFQIGFATTQICESVAVAVQTLLAREIASDSKESSYSVSHLVKTSILMGGVVASALSLLTYFQRDKVLMGLTSSFPIRQQAKAIFPAVLATQSKSLPSSRCIADLICSLLIKFLFAALVSIDAVLKGLAYPVNGIIMGGLDWKFTMAAMWLANFVCVGILKLGPESMSLNKIWWALAAFMGTQVVTGVIRVQSRTGVWKKLYSNGVGSS